MAKAADVASQTRALWAGLTGRRKLAVVAGVVVPIALIAALVLTRAGPSYTVLYSNLSPEDAGEIAGELSRLGADYRLKAGGTVIEVHEDKVHELRISTASSGLPRGGGIGFEVFDAQSFGTSSFVEQVNYRRALSGELSRTIGSLAAVSGARVHIAMGKRSVFRDADEPPSASVALRLYPGKKLTDNQVRGIVNLVASSVDGLDPEKVVVIDDRGTVLSSDEEDPSAVASGADFEGVLAAKIEGILERVVGTGHAAVTVTARIDKRKVDTTEELFDPTQPSVRSETRTIEGRPPTPPTPAAGIAGAPGSLDGGKGPTAIKAEGEGKLHEVRNYELNRTVRHTVGPTSEVARLHVAVLVDFARDDEGKPVARTTEQLAELTAIAREAAGIDDARGDRLEVRSVPFMVDPALEPPPEEVAADSWPLPISKQLTAIAAGGLIAFIAFIVVMIRRRRYRKRTENLVLPAPVRDIEAALANAESAEEEEPAKELAAPDLHTRVLASVAENPARAGRVIAAWLSDAAKNESKAA